jgi:hypothetical protein
MPRHRSRRAAAITGKQSLNNRQMFVSFLCKTMAVIAGSVMLPRHIAKRPEQHLQATDLVLQEAVPTRIRNAVVQATVHRASLVDETRTRLNDSHEFPNVVGEGVQVRQTDATASSASRLTFEDAPHLANLADIASRNAANDGSAIGEQVNNADPGECDQRFADRRVTDAEARRQLLRRQALTRTELPVEHVG